MLLFYSVRIWIKSTTTMSSSHHVSALPISADLWSRLDEVNMPPLWNKRPKRPWIAHLSIQAKIQTFNFEIWVTFDQGQRMTLTTDTHSTSLTHWVECFKQLWDQRLHSYSPSSFHMNFGSKWPNCFLRKTSFNFEIWVTFDQGQRMTLTFDTHSTS